ncbi:Z1 domain-containing protein [Micromonospora auratinigra]|uniref:Z1 domain-containing protein n=1 Tax=Micromonospora auratinigra TaxID=261654 RepID=A0A1A9A8I0_9ACTN|nr:Z1 domain-containing protein [Micromonospora auratinigra]SBT52470.1 Z1 domain-containing protein [Micromonospora auratinigra]
MSAVAHDPLAKAIRLVLGFLPQDRQPKPEEVQNAVNAVFGMLAAQGEDLDRDQLAKEIEAMTAVFQERSLALVDLKGHEPWLSEAKNDRGWDFWERYRRYLEDVVSLPPGVVRRLDQSTDEVLGQLEDPRRSGTWSRKGLVIGQVQSGKTGQYIGLAAKAVDAGYRLVVVLAGIHDDLRSQTQLRIDEGLLGFDTQHYKRSNEVGKSRLIGAGRMPFAKKLDIASPTNSTAKGDFDRKTASHTNFPLGSFPVVLVVKKHWRLLEYVRDWVVHVHGTENEKGAKIVKDLPFLVIDDEADNASIDTTRDDEADPTKTNAAIREMISVFDQSAYVGYTATPFANIYIDPDADHDRVGRDLFPASFIRTLPSPSNYLGPERVFGLQVDDEEEEDTPPLPLVRHVNDAEDWLPAKHKSGDRPKDGIPRSLREAIASFVLASAARRARGQTRVHNSMLVHVTRFTAVQDRVREQVDDHVRLLVDTLRDRYGKGPELRAEFRELWERDFVPTTDHFPSKEAERLTWEQVSGELLDAVRKIQVKAVNGTSKDALDYYDHRKSGLSVIAVGGQKLSRGLTLYGLTVSYYLRWSTSYDALLQMGRWFGYRPKHEDLCRLYTTPELEDAYVEVTAATDELRREVEEMAAIGLTPEEFGLKVRSSSLGLTVTAPNKMRKGKKILLSYSGEGPETVIFQLDEKVVAHNFKALKALVERLDEVVTPTVRPRGGNVQWDQIPPEVVSEFLIAYEADRMAQRVRPRLIAKYIDQCVKVGELTDWTVCLIGSTTSKSPQTIAGHTVGAVTRAPLKKDFAKEGRYTIRRVLSPPDELLGLDENQRQKALQAARKAAEEKEKDTLPQCPSGTHIRRQRRPKQGLLLLYPIQPESAPGLQLAAPLVGFQVSLPHSEFQSKTEYIANSVWLAEEIYSIGEEGEA